jgi:hypothetical protein
VLLDEKEPFFKRLQDRVVFSRGSVVSVPVDVVVRFSQLAPDSISGDILGTNATYASLQPVFEDRSDAFSKMESAFSDGLARLSSKQVAFTSISRRGWREEQPANEPLNVVGAFECFDLLVDEREPDRDLDLTTSGITFYLPEDCVLWGPSSVELGFDAFTFRPKEGKEIVPGIECRFTVKGQPSIIYDGAGRSSHRTLSCILPTLLCSTTEGDTSYSEEAFHADAKPRRRHPAARFADVPSNHPVASLHRVRSTGATNTRALDTAGTALRRSYRHHTVAGPALPVP